MYTLLIGLHAAAGGLAFVAGVAALPRGRFFEVYRWSLAAMALFLVLAIASNAASRDPGDWLIPGALAVLAGLMVGRAWKARRMLPIDTGGRTAAYVHHVGFGLVGLFDAFWVVALMRADVAGAAVVAIGAGIAVAGHLLLMRIAARIPVTVA